MSVETLQSLPATETNSAPRYNVRRIRLGGTLDAERGVTRIGLTNNAAELFGNLVFRRFLLENGRSLSHVSPQDVPEREHTLSDQYAEVSPPLTRELAYKMGQALVAGAMVTEWHPEHIDVATEGVVVIDNTNRVPETPIDTAGEVIATSLQYR